MTDIHETDHELEEADEPIDQIIVNRDISAFEATELARVRSHYTVATSIHRPSSVATARRPRGGIARLQYEAAKVWRNQISIVVEHEACRDHLALERTFLAYLRTSLALSMMGVTVAQLFRLQHSLDPNAIFGFYVLGKPLGCICQGSAICALLLGAYRTWRHQHAMVRGKAIAGGFEMVWLGLGTFVTCLMFFLVVMAVDVSKGNP